MVAFFLPDLKIADIINDLSIFMEAKGEAAKTITIPDEFSSIRSVLNQRFGHDIGMILA